MPRFFAPGAKPQSQKRHSQIAKYVKAGGEIAKIVALNMQLPAQLKHTETGRRILGKILALAKTNMQKCY